MSWSLFRKLSFPWLSFPWQTGRLVLTATEGSSLWTMWTEPPPGSVPPAPRPHRVWPAPTPFSRWSSWTAGERYTVITGRSSSKSQSRRQWWLLMGQWSRSELSPFLLLLMAHLPWSSWTRMTLNRTKPEKNEQWRSTDGFCVILNWLLEKKC